MSRKAIKKSVKQSVEYSIALFFVALFLISSLYSLPGTNFSRSQSENKNSGSTASKLDSSYKRYCVSDEGNGSCVYVAINDDVLEQPIGFFEQNLIYSEEPFLKESFSLNLIRAPPVLFS